MIETNHRWCAKTHSQLAAGANNPKKPMHAVALIEGLPISLASHEETLSEIGRAISAGEKGRYISITNSESMYHGLRTPALGCYIQNADFSLCDGIGVCIAGWAWGHHLARFPGPVLQLECSRHGVSKGWRHFFYGGKEGVAEEMARRLKEKYPGLVVCGIHVPPFRALTANEDDNVVRLINESRPDIVWVGLGCPKQDQWIAQHLGRIDAAWMVGVGAAFDFHAGTVPWAPAYMRALGLEWLFRTIVQPRLRAKRTWWSALYVVRAFFSGLLTGQFLRRPMLYRPDD